MTLTIMVLTGMLGILLAGMAIVMIWPNKTWNKPTGWGWSALFMPLLLLTFFFTELFGVEGAAVEINETFFNLLWWGIAAYALFFGIREWKNNHLISLLSIYCTLILTALQGFMFLISSM